MIPLTEISINHLNHIIETRRKIYLLALDLNFSDNIATKFASSISELLFNIFQKINEIKVQLLFEKNLGNYHLFIRCNCPEDVYHKINRELPIRSTFIEKAENSFIDIKLTINNPDFIPNENFLQNERERLIQQSSGDMLQEIRRKNIELQQALKDLKTSTEVIQVEKMRALGFLTAGVAHELNNPMMGILNYIQYAIKHTERDNRIYNPLIDAEKEIKRCQDIIDNLLTFSHAPAEGEEKCAKIKLSSLIERILQLLIFKINTENIKIIKQYPQKEPKINIKVNKIQQVILNLISNAIDAMKDSSTKELSLIIEVMKNELTLGVADTGIGISEETLDRIFDPFFTTKKVGQGTGLGLSVTKSIIEEHQGSLQCSSKIGQGTLFLVTLPLDGNEDENE